MDGEATDDNKAAKTPEKILAEQAARKASRERGLNKIENLDVFATWLAFGGLEHGLSWRDAAEMDAADRDDCRFLLSELGHGRKERDKKKPPDAPSPKPRRMNPRR